ncbi:hypothetical protein IF2G_06226 [Cordyceps javanica]|nr:hypothetical protein IF2G_06226 [Cordyceps javanica]
MTDTVGPLPESANRPLPNNEGALRSSFDEIALLGKTVDMCSTVTYSSPAALISTLIRNTSNNATGCHPQQVSISSNLDAHKSHYKGLTALLAKFCPLLAPQATEIACWNPPGMSEFD